MKAIVIYESVYGNTRAIAEAVAEGIGGMSIVQSVARAAEHERPLEAELLVVGGPTHMHGLATARSRQMAVSAAEEDGGITVVEGAAQEPGLRRWLRDLPAVQAAHAAAFDTRLDRSPWLTGVAARGIARRLRRRGYEVIATESFLVQDSEGPLERGELERAREWGEHLAASLPSSAARAA